MREFFTNDPIPSIFPQIALAIGVLTSSIGVRVRRFCGFVLERGCRAGCRRCFKCYMLYLYLCVYLPLNISILIKVETCIFWIGFTNCGHGSYISMLFGVYVGIISQPVFVSSRTNFRGYPVIHIPPLRRKGIGVPAAVVSGLSAAHTAAGTFCWHRSDYLLEGTDISSAQIIQGNSGKNEMSNEFQWHQFTSSTPMDTLNRPEFHTKKRLHFIWCPNYFWLSKVWIGNLYTTWCVVSCWNRSNCFLCHYFISWIFGKLGSVISVVLLRSS